MFVQCCCYAIVAGESCHYGVVLITDRLPCPVMCVIWGNVTLSFLLGNERFHGGAGSPVSLVPAPSGPSEASRWPISKK